MSQHSLSQVPGSPTFRSAAVNAVAVIPLLSSDRLGHDNPDTHSSQSFRDLLAALVRYHSQNASDSDDIGNDYDNNNDNNNDETVTGSTETLLVVPNSNLTKPGDWKYDETPLHNFHWSYGCQRMTFFDGRPYNSRMAHDRLINHELTRNWIDLCPQRRTAAVIGVLNLKDCPDEATLKRAKEEWEQWAERYSTPPYEVTAHGRDVERDTVVRRLFVFESFDESNPLDLSVTLNGSNLVVAFPPKNEEGNRHVMDGHMNVVVNDLAVSIFRELETRIRECDEMTKANDPSFSTPSKPRFFNRTGSRSVSGEEETPRGSVTPSISSLAAVVSPDSKLAARDATKITTTTAAASSQTKFQNSVKQSSTRSRLLTPMDDVFDFSELNPRDAHEMMRREVGRREKFAADLSLLAGSPLDAYERYMKAAEHCRSTCPDPLWYASSLEGCVATHIAMAEMGGFNVDAYLENSFQLPERIMACAIVPSNEKSTTAKQDMPSIVHALCEDALDVLSRHGRLACFRAELLLKLAWYCAEIEDTHLRCQWGLGEGCFDGGPNSSKKRWESASSTQLNFLELKNKRGEDVIARHTLIRSQKFSGQLHQAAAAGGLDPVTRADVSLRCVSLCLKGIRPTTKPTLRGRAQKRLLFRRKASFFAVAAAEAMSEVNTDTSDARVATLWAHANRLLSTSSNENNNGKYGWATLRAAALHGLAMQGAQESSENAAIQLLALMGEIVPTNKSSGKSSLLSKLEGERDKSTSLDSSFRSDDQNENAAYVGTGESVVSAARTYVRETRAKVAEARRANFFSGVAKDSSLLTVAQSKWVEDDEIPTILLPMAEFSEISESILAMRAVWSAIKFETCFAAQKRITKEIIGLRQKIPSSSFPRSADDRFLTNYLPINIVELSILDPAQSASLERVKIQGKEKDESAMATFFNPYANKKGKNEAIPIPEEEERFILARFANSLTVPIEIPRCQIEFDVSESSRIKAPAISFVIPGQSKNVTVRFPFTILANTLEKDRPIFGIKGFRLTCLARSFFLPIDNSNTVTGQTKRNIPDCAALYPRRTYSVGPEKSAFIQAPKIEVVPAQPNLLVSFASSDKHVDEDIVIPIPIADGEVYELPKLFLSNDAGINGKGRLEELIISASGVPGKGNLALFSLSGQTFAEGSDDRGKTRKSVNDIVPLILSANCDEMNADSLNTKKPGKHSSMSLRLQARSDLGAHIRSSTIKVTLRYRGEPLSSTHQVWRKRIIELRVLRIKGPRISSLTFRPDLSWISHYKELCFVMAKQKSQTYRSIRLPDSTTIEHAGSSDIDEFVANRVGSDAGIHVCGDKVVALVTVANESTAIITLSSPNGPVGGFDGNEMQTMTVNPGVSARIPILLPRIDRSSGVDDRVIKLTEMQWKSEVPNSASVDATETGGTIMPINRRPRVGTIQIPTSCLKTIIDENPMFLSRICDAPCSIQVGVLENDSEVALVELGEPLRIRADIQLSDWIPDHVLQSTRCTLEFCCARKGVHTTQKVDDQRRDFAFSGHTRKCLHPGLSTQNTRCHNEKARIVFLSEGEYVISSCVSFTKSGAEDAKETWWAERAQVVKVQRPKQ